ncbi:MAG TPA: DUF5698 domain-containing protein [Clostridia bacterium]|nr:DUF5698 domain-containing protein [Clostridia bacterium]
MVHFFDVIGRFFSGTSILVYACIFCGKILEVSLGTLRIVLINRGERIIGACIALIEITLWLVIAGSVLADYQSDPIKMFAYAFAFALGNFIGSWLEEKLAFGLCSIQVVVMSREKSDRICAELRRNGFGVTQLTTRGMDDTDRYLIMCTLRRKLSHEAIGLIQNVEPDAVITVSDVKSQRGGYLRQAPTHRRRKSL